MTKLLVFLIFTVCLNMAAFAEFKQQKNIKFRVIGADLMKGDIHYSFSLMEPKVFKKKYGYIRDLDSLKVRNEPNIKILLTKAVFVVKTQIGFFDHEHMKNKNYLKHLHAHQTLEDVSDGVYRVTNPDYSYTLKTFFDSDDISSLPNSAVVRAMTAAKKIDVISQSASSLVFNELTNFTSFSLGETSVTTYMGLKEDYTLVMHYQVSGIRTSFANKKKLKQDYLQELQFMKKAIESFQVPKPQ
jgi:hypothetical protein